VGSQGDGSAQLVCKSEADQAGEVAEFLEISNLAMGNPSLFLSGNIFFFGNIFFSVFFSGNTLSMDTT